MVREGIALAYFRNSGTLRRLQITGKRSIYLKQYIILDRKIDRMLADLERQRSRLGKLTPILGSDMPGGGGSISQ